MFDLDEQSSMFTIMLHHMVFLLGMDRTKLMWREKMLGLTNAMSNRYPLLRLMTLNILVMKLLEG